ncbi:CcdB family protein [Candidatus Accumulibacter sp. ACC003]|uniref:CcdB family protein n=1 Tax=Candidatus Accumulibacter sp. ACC003 TaxID=2823334 RepID=UPI0025BABF0D|nr:CcdB family protein [Candidatus Accumulibacter sp. ACC003]
MAQFSVHRNPNPDSSTDYPLLLDVQSNLIAELGTRVAVPLCPASTMKGQPLKTLTPLLQIDGKQYIMLTPQLAGIQKKHLGTEVANLTQRRDEIIAALDFLITGI